MDFYTVSKEKRPVRLSNATREFAFDSLNHTYGLDTIKTPSVKMDDTENFENLSHIDQYDKMIRKIVEEAPIRICKDEKISGAATLGVAISHYIPATYKNQNVFMSVSHLTINFEKVLKIGIDGIEKEIKQSLLHHTEEKKIRFLTSCQNTIDSMRIWHNRYLTALKGKSEYKDNYNNLVNVPFKPATNFYEAVQSIWFTFAFTRLCGNWPGIGRIDYLLGEYLKKDLNSGIQTIDSAREILAHFFIKGCEWIKGGDCVSGDAQHYQNIVLSGIDGNNNDITNEVTYLVLDIIEELGISDFPVSVRLNKNTSEKLLSRCAEVLKFGGGILAFYNEDMVIKSFILHGYSKDEAWKFANDGCWEVQIPGRTYFNYKAFDALQTLQDRTFNGYENIDYKDFESVYKQFIINLENRVKFIVDDQLMEFNFSQDKKSWTWKDRAPCTVVSIFEDGCIEKGLSYLEGGPIYNVDSLHIGGFADIANFLYAVKKIVFDDKLISFKDFMEVLKNNWEGNEELKRIALTKYTYWGNDNDEVDEIASRFLGDFGDMCEKYSHICGYTFPAGVSTFGRQLEWRNERRASAHGYKPGDVLAPNCSPTPGTDRKGATAIIKSYAKLPLEKIPIGAALDVKLLSNNIEGEDGVNALISLLKGFVLLGGFFMQPDICDKDILKKAQQNPEKYQHLSVRVSGWNARFVTLNKSWQDMIINENK